MQDNPQGLFSLYKIIIENKKYVPCIRVLTLSVGEEPNIHDKNKYSVLF